MQAGFGHAAVRVLTNQLEHVAVTPDVVYMTAKAVHRCTVNAESACELVSNPA